MYPDTFILLALCKIRTRGDTRLQSPFSYVATYSPSVSIPSFSFSFNALFFNLIFFQFSQFYISLHILVPFPFPPRLKFFFP